MSAHVREDEALLSMFEDALLARGRTPITLNKFKWLARRFLASVPEEEDPFTKRAVTRYLAQLRREGAKNVYLKWSYYGLRAFFLALDKLWPFARNEAPKGKSSEEGHLFSNHRVPYLELRRRPHW